MQSTALTKERVSRLTGRGRTDDRGGGLPLVDLFEPILRTLMNGPGAQPDRQLEVLTAAVRSGFIGRKEDRLQYMYRTSDPWPAIMADALEQAESVGLLVADGTGWKIGPKFAVDKPLTVIRASGGAPAIRITVASETARAARQGEALLMDVTSLATELDARRNGLRPVNRDRVAELVVSMHAVGYVKDSKIYKDQYGRVLDGRHRLAAAEVAGITLSEATHYRTIMVSSDQEALEWAWHLNKGQASWTKSDVDRLTRLLGGRHPDTALPGRLVRAQIALEAAKREIQAGAEGTQREIADAAKVSIGTVNHALRALKEAGEEIQSPAEVKREAIREDIAADPNATDYAIAKARGVSQHTVKSVREELLQSVQPTEQNAVEEPASEPSAPKASPTRQNWTLGWHGDYGQAPEKIVRKLMREPDIAHEVLRLLREHLGE